MVFNDKLSFGEGFGEEVNSTIPFEQVVNRVQEMRDAATEELMEYVMSSGESATEADVLALIASGADPNACCNSFGGSALHVAAFWDNAEVASALIAAGADVNATDDVGTTPLHDAAANNSTRVAKVLIEAGADVSARDGTGDTPFHFAAFGARRALRSCCWMLARMWTCRTRRVARRCTRRRM